VLPKIERQAHIDFREVRCASRKADCIQEVISLCWKWFIRLLRRGKDASRFARTLASLAARAVRSGRRAWGHIRTGDVFSPMAQRKNGFVVRSIASERRHQKGWSSPMDDVLENQLVDNTATSPLDQAQFRIDFREWLKRYSARQHRIIRSLSTGQRTMDVSRKFNITAGRVSQMRRAFKDDWERFVGDKVNQPAAPKMNTTARSNCREHPQIRRAAITLRTHFAAQAA